MEEATTAGKQVPVTTETGYGPALKRAVPVGIALFPVGLLFGVLANQVGWRPNDILLMSLIGFTGSGQFALLKFVQEGVGYAVTFLIILCMNLRYVPMALSASRPLKIGAGRKFFMSHFVSDESYAAERRDDNIRQRAAIRLTIVFFWTASTVTGVVSAGYLPEQLSPYILGLTFPISALLFLLSALNVFSFVSDRASLLRSRIAAVAICTCISLGLIAVLGQRYFWIPGIVVSFLVLNFLGGSDDD
jgi:predicted branched-subunit amino acid permease